MMNFKIEINYLNIDNYPSVEAHFEEIASKGWLIDKVLVGSIFIYKKIEPQALDFSISPYEVETAFTRKTKKDLEEFQTVSEMVGWNYAAKSYDLHIYYKSVDSEAVPIHTDEEEEFKLLEKIGKRYLRNQYFLMPFLLLFLWPSIWGLLNDVEAMRDGMSQIVGLLIPASILLSGVHIYDLRKFLKANRKNIEQGKSMTFNTSRQWLYKGIYTAITLLFLVLALYILYSVFVLKNPRAIRAFLPVLIGGFIGLLFRIWVKPIKKGSKFKWSVFVIMIVIAGTIGFLISPWTNTLQLESQEILDPTGLRVLRMDDFADETIEERGELERDISFLMPASHDYDAFYEEDYLRTEYSNAMTESLAENLVERYFARTENRLRGRYDLEISQAFSDGEYHPDLESSGFTEEDFNQMYEEGAGIELQKIWDRIEEQSITDASQIWDVDEAYFLSYDREAIVLREDKEIFYLAGLDFSDPTIVENAKAQLQIN